MELNEEEFLNHFRRCTVAVVRGSEVLGTGFFAAPGRVVSCAHVVRDAGAAESSRIDVRWGKVTILGTVAKIGNPGSVEPAGSAGQSDPDLALIRCERGPFGLESPPPCVLLTSKTPNLVDRKLIYAFGHAAGEYQENGESLTLDYEGVSFDARNRRVLKFKEGNVKEGMSGSPLLDFGSGSVCGVLFVSRDTGSSLGGRAIPTDLLFGMFPDLRKEHDAYHLQHARWKSLWHHRGADSAASSVGIAQVPVQRATPKQRFVQQEGKYRISAREFHVEKRRDSFGNSSVTYRLVGLTSREELRGVRWCFRSTIGIISSPIVSENEAQVAWTQLSSRRDEVLEVQSKLEEMHKLEGVFRFLRPLPADREISFSWTLEILNQYALSDWEFENLYGEFLHFDGSKIEQPMEFFPHVVWFPVQKLILSLALPPGLNTRPALRIFHCQSTPLIEKKDVLAGSILEGSPALTSTWNRREEWVEDRVSRKRISDKLVPDPEGRPDCWQLEVDEPEVGTCFSLEWPLPITFLMVVRSAEEIRRRLVEQGKARRLNHTAISHRDGAHQAFREFAEGVRDRYGISGNEERFEVTLMTYDAQKRSVVVADGLLNGTDLEPKDWEFAVPFGVGLAGACFREGREAMLWVREERNDGGHFDNYLEFSEKDRHQVLLVLPIDHPGLAEVQRWHDWESGMSLRSQQLLGVVTIASDHPESPLLILSTKSRLEEEGEDLSGERVKEAMAQLAEMSVAASTMGQKIAHHYGWSR